MYLIFIFFLVLLHSQKIQYPIKFTTIRQLQHHLPPRQLLSYLGLNFNISYDSYNSYNYISFQGWTFNNGLYGACYIWKNAQKYLSIPINEDLDTHTLQKKYKSWYEAKKINLLVSAFSKNQFPNSQLMNARQVAFNLSVFCVQNYFDGVTIELQDLFGVIVPKNNQWIIKFTKYLKQFNPNGIIVYHLYASYFQQNLNFLDILMKIQHLIDFFVIKFYDLMQQDYQDQQSLFIKSNYYHQTSVKQINNKGFPLNKIVVGKPINKEDIYNNTRKFYIQVFLMREYLGDAYKNLGWYGGYSNYDYYNDLNGQILESIMENLQQSCNNFENCI